MAPRPGPRGCPGRELARRYGLSERTVFRFPPRTRGSTEDPEEAVDKTAVSPAHAGIDLHLRSISVDRGLSIY
jgi:hypothetical protein